MSNIQIPRPVSVTLKLQVIRKDGTVENIEPIKAAIEK